MNIEFLFTLKFTEIVLFISLFAICLNDLSNYYKNKNWINIFNPASFFSLLTIIYCLIGPLVTRTIGDGSIIYRGMDHREYYELGLFASLVSYLSFRLGFKYKKKFFVNTFGINDYKYREIEKNDFIFLHKCGERIVLFTLLIQFLLYGPAILVRIFSINNQYIDATYGFGLLNPLFGYTVNFFIFGLTLIFLALVNGSREFTKFFLYLIITLGIFINLGFRYRLLLLIVPLVIIYFFYKNIKPSLKLLASIFLSGILTFGLIQVTRTYGQGLDFEKIEIKYGKSDNNNIFTIAGYAFKAAFYDANIFHTSAAIISKTPQEYDYVGLRPILNAIALPIPRQIWPNKPEGRYIFDAYKNIYTGYREEVGTASLGFAEYYLSAGWIGLITISFLIGIIYKKLWCWLVLNYNDPLAQTIYALNFGFLYIIFSRGYLLQLFYVYISIFLPVFFISRVWRNRFRK